MMRNNNKEVRSICFNYHYINIIFVVNIYQKEQLSGLIKYMLIFFNNKEREKKKIN